MISKTLFTTILNKQTRSIVQLLQEFADGAFFEEKVNSIFGRSVSSQVFKELVTALPEIDVVADETLHGASGAFSAQTGRIYLAETLLQGDGKQLQAVLLEEIGHYLDHRINAVDTRGDEGEYFAKVVLNQPLTEAEIGRLKAENDQAVVVIDGQFVQIEQAITLAGKWDRLSNASAVTTAGNYAYIVGDTFDIVDISDPGNPVFKGNYDLGVAGSYIYLSGDYAYVTGRGG